MSARSTRWLAYARWQVLDCLWQRFALPFALPAMLTFFMFYSAKSASAAPGFWASSEGRTFSAMVFRQAMAMFIPLAVILGVSGMASQDRQKGHFRFLFSKPLPVPGFYLMAFVVHFAVAVTLAGLLAAAVAWNSSPQPVLGAVATCALTFVLIGGLAFALSTITKLDGALLVVLWLGTLLVRQVEPNMRADHWMHTAVRALPPTHRLDAVRDALYASQPVAMHDVWYVLAYGGACVAVGLLALRRLPLSR